MKMTDDERTRRLIALGTTLLFAAALVLWLLFTSLRYDEKLASAQNPQLEEEELFLDPELLLEPEKSIGEPEAVNHDAPAPEVKGEPQPAPVEQPHTVHSAEATTPSAEQNLVQTPQEAPVQTAEPDRKKEDEKVATSMAGKFGSNPGSVAGKFATQGSGGVGSGVSGKMAGRQFMGCPIPDVTLSHRTTVSVSITVDAEGNVTSARASGATTQEIRRKCEEAAMKARWSAKKGAASTRGTITFTIIPK